MTRKMSGDEMMVQHMAASLTDGTLCHYVTDEALRSAMVDQDPTARSACGLVLEGAPLLVVTTIHGNTTCRACLAAAPGTSP